MKVIVDENIPRRTVMWLRGCGHEVLEASKPPLKSSDDEVLWGVAQRDRALLVTTDRGFAAKWAEAHYGILIVRLRQPNREKIHDRVVLAMEERPTAEQWRGLLCVMRDQVFSTRIAPKGQ